MGIFFAFMGAIKFKKNQEIPAFVGMMSLPNRAGILTPVDGLDEGEQVTMLVMPVMLNS
ncbi:hypothetical protein [Lacinutrix sp. MEBiC02404]